MVKTNIVDIEIKRKHDKVYGGGHRIFVGSTDKKPIKLTAQLILDNPDVLRTMKKSFPFEGEILSSPDMPDIVKELVDTTKKTPKKEAKSKAESRKDEPREMIKSDLEKLSFGKLKKLAKKYGETGRSKSGLIKDILKHDKVKGGK